MIKLKDKLTIFIERQEKKSPQNLRWFKESIIKNYWFKQRIVTNFNIVWSLTSARFFNIDYSTVTDFAKLRGLSTSARRCKAA